MNTSPGVYGRKIGNTQIFTDDGNVKRVTVVEAGPLTILGKRTKEKDGYVALVFGLDERKEKHTKKPVAGQYKAEKGLYKEANTTAKRTIKELRCDDEFLAKFEVGSVVKLDEIFTEGQFIDAQAKTRGRGFTGVMRRWNFSGFPATHGTHEYRRHGGSIGTNMTPGRTLPNIKMPGQYGNETVSMMNLKVIKVLAEKNLLLIEGGIPGSKGSLVLVRHAVKKKGKGKK